MKEKSDFEIKRAKININTSENETAIIAPFKTFNNKFDLTLCFFTFSINNPF